MAADRASPTCGRRERKLEVRKKKHTKIEQGRWAWPGGVPVAASSPPSFRAADEVASEVAAALAAFSRLGHVCVGKGMCQW